MVKRIIKCAECGSTDVVRDAWASYDQDSDEWVLDSLFDQAFCRECECNCELDEEELPAEPTDAEIKGVIAEALHQGTITANVDDDEHLFPRIKLRGWDSVEGGAKTAEQHDAEQAADEQAEHRAWNPIQPDATLGERLDGLPFEEAIVLVREALQRDRNIVSTDKGVRDWIVEHAKCLTADWRSDDDE